MKRLIALVLTAAVAASGCATRGPALSRATPAAADRAPSAQAPVDVWRRFAGELPIGATVRIQTQSGERFTGVLLVVDDTGITVSPKTRIPEPPRQVPYDGIARIEPLKNGSSLVKAAVIGAGVGGATFFGLLWIMFAVWGD